MSKPSHPTEDPRCHQLDIVVKIHNAEGGRRSPPQFFLCVKLVLAGFCLVVNVENYIKNICVYVCIVYILYIYIIYLYLFVPTVHNLSV